MKKYLNSLIFIGISLLIVGCGGKDPKDVRVKDLVEDLPAWYMQPKDAMGKDYICEVGSDPTRTGALLEGKENLMALIETEVKYSAETRRNAGGSAWRAKTEFRSEGMLRNSFIAKHTIGPDQNVYILLCVNKADLEWQSW